MERLLFPSNDMSTAEVATVGGLTLGDILYSAVSIDPKVIAAADFTRAEDLADLARFGAFTERISGMSGNVEMELDNNLRGYGAEQIVAVRMFEKGHQVGLPETLNNANYDLLINGTEVQVECLTDIKGLAEHSNTPVIANSELAKDAADSGATWANQVMFVDGFDRETSDTLLDFGYTLKGGPECRHGPDELRRAVLRSVRIGRQTIARKVEGNGSAGRRSFRDHRRWYGSLTVAGGLAGKALGLLLFGPAGAVVVGGAGGVVSLFGTQDDY